jgi:hypothetical protein
MNKRGAIRPGVIVEVVDKSLPLRRRVGLYRVSFSNARYMLEELHYLHRMRTGRQVNYVVTVNGIVDGIITYAVPKWTTGALGVPSAEIVELARLYLYSNIPHTASCAVGKSLRTIRLDWWFMYPDAQLPRLVVAWSDIEQHEGTVYKAANFTWWKRAKGRRRVHDDGKHDKNGWVYWLK